MLKLIKISRAIARCPLRHQQMLVASVRRSHLHRAAGFLQLIAPRLSTAADVLSHCAGLDFVKTNTTRRISVAMFKRLRNMSCVRAGLRAAGTVKPLSMPESVIPGVVQFKRGPRFGLVGLLPVALPECPSDTLSTHYRVSRSLTSSRPEFRCVLPNCRPGAYRW